MGSFKILMSSVLVICIFASNASSETRKEKNARLKKEYEECRQKCGGDPNPEDMKNGKMVCCQESEDSDIGFGNDSGVDVGYPCMRECLGKPTCKDTDECWCIMCKKNVFLRTAMCAEIGGEHPTRNTCDETACKGKLRFRGNTQCKPPPGYTEEDF